LLYVPGFHKSEELQDQYCRMLWYVRPMLRDLGRVLLASSMPSAAEMDIPQYLDPQIARLSNDFRDKVFLFDDADEQAWLRAIKQADILLHWDLKSEPANAAVARELRKAIKTKKRYRVDRRNERYEGSMYLKLSHDSNPFLQRDVAESRQKFMRMVERLGRYARSWVFGTGPSLEAALDFDFSGDLTIACNSMVRNRPLLDRLEPKLFVVGDPIFHAGCSSYAGKFRQHLYEVLDNYDCNLIVPFRDYRLYMAHVPQRFADRIIGIPFEQLPEVNLDLTGEFAVKTTSNILTLFLLPLAATLSNEINIVGCDGRKMEDNKYFWSHHRASQINDEMQNIQLAHPSFFAIDYDDYYLTHCDLLERWLRAAENKGIKVWNRTPSHIPALKKRFAPISKPIRASGPPAGGSPLVSVIMPAYNAEKWIARAVASLQEDPYQNWELLVVDDHSTDATPKRVETRAASDPRIKYKVNPGKGVSAARNFGLAHAAGKYVAFLDADDVYFPNALARRVGYMESHPDVQAVYCTIRLVDEDLRDLWRLHAPPVVRFDDMHSSKMHVNAVMLRRELAAAHRFDETLRNGEDWLFFARLARCGVEFHHVDNCSVAYVLHRNSTVMTDIVKHEDTLLGVLAGMYRKDPQCPHPLAAYRNGLNKPPLETIVFLRRLRLLIELILREDRAEAERVLAQVADKLTKHAPAEAASRVRLAFMRYFTCNRVAWASHWRRRGGQVIGFFQQRLDRRQFHRLQEGLFAETERLAARDAPPPGPVEPEEKLSVNEIRLIHEYLKGTPGSKVMIDVGAHFGGSSRPFLSSGWRVYAFEPDPANRKKLESLVTQFPGLSIDPRAVGEREETDVPFYTSEVSTGVSGLTPYLSSHTETTRVDVTTLRCFCQEEGIAAVQLLKIDTEGFDLHVLKGFPWERLKPEVILCEFEDFKTKPLGYAFGDMAHYLEDRGYEVVVSEWYPIEQYGTSHSWRRFARYPCRLEDPKGWGNLIAFRDGVDWPRLLTAASRIAAQKQIMVDNRDRMIAQLKQAAAKPQPTSEKSGEKSVARQPALPSRISRTMNEERKSPSVGLRSRRLPPDAGRVARIKFMLKQIVKWHLRWAGLALVLTVALLAYALSGMPGAMASGAAGVAMLFVTIGYVNVRAQHEAEDQAVSERKRAVAILTERLDVERRWTGREIVSKQAESDRKLAALKGAFARMERELAAAREEAADKQAETGKQLAGLKDAFARMERELAAAREALATAREELHAEIQTTASTLSSAEGEELHAEIQTTASTLSSAEARSRRKAAEGQKRLSEQTRELQEQVVAVQANQKETAVLLDRKPFQPFSRRLDPSDEKLLLERWAPRLKVKANRSQIRYLQQRISYIEDHCLGRLAGSVQDAILRLLTGIAAAGDHLNLLEIGTLFGTNAVLMYDVLSCYSREVNLTLIDPMDGYYGNNTPDVITGLPVNEQILRQNFARAMVPPERWRLIRDYSQNNSAVKAADDRRYEILFIDGDHSFEGVKRDFELYAPMLTDGGYVIFDDYHSDRWPEVTKAVDEVVAKDARLQPVGTEWETAIFRKKASAGRGKA